jgi:hypothetical protein
MISGQNAHNKSIFLRNPLLKLIGEKRFNLREYLAQKRKPPYSPCHDKIILDITYACTLKCVKCNRSCRYAPSDDFMTLSQIERFISESVNQKRKWRQIWIEGGEPTLNPELDSILDLIMDYKNKHNPLLKIQLNSNGFGDETVRKLERIGKRIKIYSSGKTSPDVKYFCAFNLAPCDFEIYQNIDYSMGCYFPSFYGLSLNMNGYYHCSNAGGIDRVLGLDIGKRILPQRGDIWWKKQMSELCKYCGHFQINNRHYLSTEPPQVDYLISASWRKIYEEYHSHKVSLTRY